MPSTWLEDVQREDVLTSLAEVTGSDLAAEGQTPRLSLWHQQGMERIEAVTIRAEESDFDFSMIRSLLTMRAETNVRRGRNFERRSRRPVRQAPTT